LRVDDILGHRARSAQGRIIAVVAMTGVPCLFSFRSSIVSLLDMGQTPEYCRTGDATRNPALI